MECEVYPSGDAQEIVQINKSKSLEKDLDCRQIFGNIQHKDNQSHEHRQDWVGELMNSVKMSGMKIRGVASDPIDFKTARRKEDEKSLRKLRTGRWWKSQKIMVLWR